MAKRTITKVRGNKFLYEYRCLDCEWEFFSFTKTGNRTRAERRGEDGGRSAMNRHLLLTNHSVEITRRWVIERADPVDPSGLRGYLAGIYDGPGGATA